MAAHDPQRMIRRLNELASLDHDAVGTYQAAIDRIEQLSIRERLRELQETHRRDGSALGELVRRLGGEPRDRPDVKGYILKGFTAATSMIGTEPALRALQGYERLVSSAYRQALGEEWPEDVGALLAAHLRAGQRHLSYLEEALRNRIWEQEPAQP